YIDWQYSSIHEQISPYHSTYVYLGIYTVLVALTMYVKYRQVKEIFSRHDIRSSYKVNIISFYVGMLAATGISLVANFPETSVLTVHVTGAFMAFGLGAVYQCLQVGKSIKLFLYYKVSHVMENKYRNIIRLMLSIVSIVTFFICAVFALIAFGMYDGDTIQNWKKEDNGFRFHIISTVSEWVCASCTLTFICMFQTEFEDIDMKEPQICIEDNFVRRVDNRDMELKIYDRY
ncbi:hypothetical protein NQ318_018297, partial [Aromia moschata]